MFRFARGTVGKLGLGMHAGTVLVVPRSVAGAPGGDDPSPFLVVVNRHIRLFEDLVLGSLAGELRCAFEYDTVLTSQVAELFRGPILEP